MQYLIEPLPDADFDRLDGVYWSSDQVHGGVLPSRQLEPFYRANGRPWPPVKPSASATPNTLPF